MSDRGKVALKALLFLLGLALFGFLVWQADPRAVGEKLRGLGLAAGWFFLPSLAMYLLDALAWRFSFLKPPPVSFFRLYLIRMAGESLNNSLPRWRTDGDNELDVDEVWTYTGSTTVTAGQYANVGKVTAWFGSKPMAVGVKDEDASHHFGVVASIDIEKSTNGEDADTPTGPVLHVGDTAYFTYVVRNTGNVALTDVVVVDDQGVTITFDINFSTNQ